MCNYFFKCNYSYRKIDEINSFYLNLKFFYDISNINKQDTKKIIENNSMVKQNAEKI